MVFKKILIANIYQRGQSDNRRKISKPKKVPYQDSRVRAEVQRTRIRALERGGWGGKQLGLSRALGKAHGIEGGCSGKRK